MYASRDPEEYGRARLSHVADTWKGKLDPAEYLNPGRHGEWTTASGARPAHNPGAAKQCHASYFNCTFGLYDGAVCWEVKRPATGAQVDCNSGESYW